MPSSVGHALGGVAAAWAADLLPGDRAWRTAPRGASWFRRAGDGLTLACVVLAALPDIDLFWHVHRTMTHSIGAVILAGVLAAIVAAAMKRPVARVAFMCAAAYATHLVLDWIAVDHLPPYGLQALWPFSDRWFLSGWDLFRQTERRRFLSAATILVNTEAIAQEIAILAPIVAALWLVRVKALARFATELAGRDHPAE